VFCELGVLARLHNGREVEAKVTRNEDSVAGRKVHITFGRYAFKEVDETQIVKEMRSALISLVRKFGALVCTFVPAIRALQLRPSFGKPGLRGLHEVDYA
jgi:hypothetical protein